ncbi:MAG: N-formylglutamate amidohydrolase [Gammaproteobacteria bacterium]|nr:MAG: N-formylglutamate amidohydrolase [Gammaproteobacteria bacterium]
MTPVTPGPDPAAAPPGATPGDSTVVIVNPVGRGGFVLACEHAAPDMPPEYANLGLADELLRTHIAWDPGALGVAEELAARLDAPLVRARYSRLLYDCNRPPEAPDAITPHSEVHAIPGNVGLTPAARRQRIERFYEPYRAALAATVQDRLAAGARPVLVTVHSFTPVYRGQRRELDLGILHDTDTRLADELLARVPVGGGLRVARNAPYGPWDGVTHTLRLHALPHGLLNAMIEIRNNLIADPAAQATLAARLAGHLVAARAALSGD